MTERDLTASLLAFLAEHGQTVVVAESLTGGALTAELTRPGGASAVIVGGVVVYATELKHSLIGVDDALLAAHGPVHPEVAKQLADGVRNRLAVGDRAADIGIATTGVAGPGPQDGTPAGTVFLGLSTTRGTRAVELALDGSRSEIRRQVVTIAVAELAKEVGLPAAGSRE